jgi:hypothetical protein
MTNLNPSHAGRQHSPPLTLSPESAVKKIIAWFPKADPDPSWTAEAIRTLEGLQPEALERALSIGRSSRPKALPSIPTLFGWTEEAAAQTPKASGRSLPPPEELSRLTADYTAKWIRNNRDLIERLAAHGYPLVWRQEVTDAAFLAAQGGPAVAVSTADVDKWLDWPACPPKPLPSSILVGGRAIPL